MNEILVWKFNLIPDAHQKAFLLEKLYCSYSFSSRNDDQSTTIVLAEEYQQKRQRAAHLLWIQLQKTDPRIGPVFAPEALVSATFSYESCIS